MSLRSDRVYVTRIANDDKVSKKIAQSMLCYQRWSVLHHSVIASLNGLPRNRDRAQSKTRARSRATLFYSLYFYVAAYKSKCIELCFNLSQFTVATICRYTYIIWIPLRIDLHFNYVSCWKEIEHGIISIRAVHWTLNVSRSRRLID